MGPIRGRKLHPFLVAACVSGLLILVSIGCWGGNQTGDTQGGAAVAQVHDGPLAVRPVLLSQQPTPESPFACTSNPSGEEVVRGPSVKTNLRQARLVRTPKGVCVIFEFPGGASRYGTPPDDATLRLTFYRHGNTSAKPDAITSGKPTRSVAITAYNDYSVPPGEYLLSTSIPENGSSVGGVKLGRLGVGGRKVSLLVTDPKMPEWVLDRDTTWQAAIV